MSQAPYDVVELVDLHLPLDAPFLADELRARHDAGYRTALLPAACPGADGPSPADPGMRAAVADGAATLLLPGDEIRGRLLVVRHPHLLAGERVRRLRPAVDRVAVLAREPAPEGQDASVPAVDRLDELAGQWLGVVPEWFLTVPRSQAELPARTDGASMPWWRPVLDTDRWPGPRRHRGAPAPVLGRHGALLLAWPERREELAAAYPLGGNPQVHVLGSVQPVRQLLGQVPPGWRVLPYRSRAVAGFLQGIDIAVHQGPADAVDPHAVRPVLEAMAAGVPTIVPEPYRELLGDAACYAGPQQVPSVVRGLHGSAAAYDDASDRGARLVSERCGPAAHLRLLSGLLGEPPRRRAPRPAAAAGTAPPSPSATPARPRVLFVSSNGAGMGHLTRLLAYARALEDRAESWFLSMSQAVPVVGSWGFPYEYLPSAAATGLPNRRWQRLYHERALDVLDRYRPDVVVFDGTWPYAATAWIRTSRPAPRWVWSRRGMWRPEVPGRQLAATSWFDTVLEPGDLAAAADRGATASLPAERVGPVTLLGAADLQDRATARAALGLPADGPLGLVSLGAGNINDTSSDTGAVVAALANLGVGVCLTRTPIGADGGAVADVHVVRDYPLARRYAAFDVVVSAAGYNSFHELLRFGVPTLFVPNTATALDDQAARARYAADLGWAHHLPHVTVEAAEPLLADLLARGRQMAAGAVGADPGNGAAAAAQLLLDLAGRPARRAPA